MHGMDNWLEKDVDGSSSRSKIILHFFELRYNIL